MMSDSLKEGSEGVVLVSAQEFPINRNTWMFKPCRSVCTFSISRKKLRTPESPKGILHLAENC